MISGGTSMIVLGHRTIESGSGHEQGRQLLEELYRVHIGGDLPPIAVTERGKPYFVGSPIQFSISHTKHHVFVALSERALGIDAEETDRRVNPALANKVLSPPERARYDAAADQNSAFLRLWVLKEAAAKLAGTGLTGYPNHTDFSPDDPRVQTIHGCYVAVLEQEDNHAF
jgi:phosphopantetheinyl transferase